MKTDRHYCLSKAAFGRLEETSGVARKRGQSVEGLSDQGQEFVLDPEKLKSHRIEWRILLTCGQGEQGRKSK